MRKSSLIKYSIATVVLISTLFGGVTVTNAQNLEPGQILKKTEAVYVNADCYGNFTQVNIYNNFTLSNITQIRDFGEYEKIEVLTR